MIGGGGAAGAGDGWDFFVSYTQADRRWAEWIAWTLEEARFRVLVQAWDFTPGSNWVSGMDEGVRRAERTIAVASDDYNRSVFGAAEWRAAWKDDPEGWARKLLVMRVADCDRPGLLGLVVATDLFGMNEMRARGELLRAARLAASGKRGKPDTAPLFPPAARAVPVGVAFPGGLPTVWNVPARLAHFVGRDGLLDEVAGALGGSVVVSVVALAGMGGIGKTALAVEYAHRHADRFDVVWWVTAEQPEAVAEQMGALGEELGLAAGAEPVGVFGELRRRGCRWLLVLDNAEDTGTVAALRPADRRGRVLVTSRRAGWGGLGVTVTVPTLSRSESVALLTGRLPGIGVEVAGWIARLVDDLALAVEQAAAFCEQTGTPPETFAGILADRLDDAVELGEVAERAGVSVATLWELSIVRLGESEPAVVELLDLLAFCGPEPVPLDLFTAGAAVLGGGPLTVAASDPVVWVRTVGALFGYSLASRDAGSLWVHRLVQAATRRGASARRSGILTLLLRLFRSDLPGDIMRRPGAWPRWRVLLPHVLAVLDRIPDPPRPTDDQEPQTDIDDLVWLCDRAGTYLREHGRAGEALPLFERALSIAEAVYGPDHPNCQTIRRNLDG